MNREIKFRAWNSDTKRFVQGDRDFEGREGYNLGVFAISANGTPCFFESEEGGMGISEYANVVLMQFTGLHDAKGVEIYEGDILALRSSHKVLGIPFKTMTPVFEDMHKPVAWDSKGARFVAEPITLTGRFQMFEPMRTGQLNAAGTEEYEVIGNIYENGDLIPAV